MKKISEVTLLDVLPESILQDPKLKAAAEALDAQIRAVTLATREVLHLPRLDELSGNVLDFLAEQFHLDFYEPLYLTEDEKRNLIRESIAWHRIKGTPAAVEKIAHDAFRDAEIVEWFNYGGKPYHFKIRSHGYKQTPDGFETYIRMINAAKNVRSWIDNFEVDYSSQVEAAQAYAGTATGFIGLKTFDIAKPHDIKGTIYVGQTLGEFGGKQISLARPFIFDGNRHQFYAAQALTKGGGLIVNADLRDLPTYENIIESPLVELALADIALARDGRIKIPVEVYERYQLAELFTAAAHHLGGKKVYDLHRPENPVAKLYVGQILENIGIKAIYPTTKKSAAQILRVGIGQVLGRTGIIEINTSTKPSLADNELFFVERLELNRGIATAKFGNVTVEPTTKFKDAHLTGIRVGQVLGRTGIITIGSTTKPTWTDDELFFADRIDLNHGNATAKFGSVVIEPTTKIKDAHLMKNHVGHAAAKFGNVTVKAMNRIDDTGLTKTHVGQVLGRTGIITIGSSTKPSLADNELFFVERIDLNHGHATAKFGNVTVEPTNRIKDAHLTTIHVGSGIVRAGEISIT